MKTKDLFTVTAYVLASSVVSLLWALRLFYSDTSIYG